MSYPRNGWVNETPDQYLPHNEIPDQNLPQFAEHEWSDHHAVLHKVERTVWLGRFPGLLRVITCQGKSQDSNHMPTILKFPTADAQYAALMHYHKMARHIDRPPAARKYRCLSLQDRVTAYNMRMEGKNILDIAQKLDSSRTNVSRVLLEMGSAPRGHVPLTKDEICRIRLMRLSGASLRDIAEKMGRTHSTIKYQVDRLFG